MARTGQNAPAVKNSFAERFKQRILRNYFVRFHMTLMLAAVVGAGLLVNKLMLMAGVGNTAVRYPLAVAGSYCVFIGLVRLWIAYVCSRSDWDFGSLGNFDTGASSSGGGGGGSIGGGGGGCSVEPVRFGGGGSGGGGASDSWDAPGVRASFSGSSQPPIPLSATGPQSGGGSGGGGGGGGGGGWKWPSFDFNCDGDDLWIILLLAVVVLAVILCGGYLIWVAPEILPDVAMQAVIVPAIARRTRQVENRYWAGSLVWSTFLPFLVVLLLTLVLGYFVHQTCPGAVKLVDALACKGS